MSYYKLIKGMEIVDAVESASTRWMVENPRSLSIYVGEMKQAKGVLSSDSQTVYRLEGKEPFEDYPDFPVVRLEEITEEEYDAIRAELDEGRSVQEDQAQSEQATEEQEAKPERPKTRLQQLEEEVLALTEANQMLTECLLEMSEIVCGNPA